MATALDPAHFDGLAAGIGKQVIGPEAGGHRGLV